jgi:hypothetical protein
VAKVTDIDSPQRSPARRTRVPKPDKAELVYDLRASGKSPSEIATTLKLTVDAVKQLLDERFSMDAAYLTDTERSHILALELIRLDKLLAASWPAAMMGDPKSIDSALKVIQTRLRATHLDQTDPVVNKNLVLVMGEKEDDYINALKAVKDD